jgi:hypothetical protein
MPVPFCLALRPVRPPAAITPRSQQPPVQRRRWCCRRQQPLAARFAALHILIATPHAPPLSSRRLPLSCLAAHSLPLRLCPCPRHRLFAFPSVSACCVPTTSTAFAPNSACRSAPAPLPRSPHSRFASRESPPRLSCYLLPCPALLCPCTAIPRSPPLLSSSLSPPLCPGSPCPRSPSPHALPPMPIPAGGPLSSHSPHTPLLHALCTIQCGGSPVCWAQIRLVIWALELKVPIPVQGPVRTPGGEE